MFELKYTSRVSSVWHCSDVLPLSFGVQSFVQVKFIMFIYSVLFVSMQGSPEGGCPTKGQFSTMGVKRICKSVLYL